MATTSAVPTGVSLKDSKLFRQSNFVDGAWITARSEGTINVDNPATGEVVGTVPKCGAAETRAAIDAAFLEWFAEEAKRVYGDTIPGLEEFLEIKYLCLGGIS